MEFWASSETHQPASAGVELARHCVEPFLNAAFAKSSLANVDVELRFIPIVMPSDMHDRYTERSKARIKQRIYDCAPQLDYETFISGSFEEQLQEYLRGIKLSIPHLHKFGLTEEQIKEAESIMASAVTRIMERGPSCNFRQTSA